MTEETNRPVETFDALAAIQAPDQESTDPENNPLIEKAVKEVREKHIGAQHPQSWEECMEIDNGQPKISLRNAIRYLREKKRKGWQPPCTEFGLAISENPGREAPFSIGVFTPVLPTERNQKVKYLRNLRCLMAFSLIETGCPEEATHELAKEFTKEYGRNLDIARRVHPEIKIQGANGKIKEFTAQKILDTYTLVHSVVEKREVRTFMQGAESKDSSYRLTDDAVDEARELFTHATIIYERMSKYADDELPTDDIEWHEDKPSYSDIFSKKRKVPRRFFDTGDQKKRNETIELMMFLHYLGTLDLRDATDNPVVILRALDVVSWSCHKAEKFLAAGENIFSKAQSRDIQTPDDKIIKERGVIAEIIAQVKKATAEEKTPELLTSMLDKAESEIKAPLPHTLRVDRSDFLEDLKVDQLMRLVAYALDAENPVIYRNQALALLSTRLKFIGTRLNEKYENGKHELQNFHEAMLNEKIGWLKKENGDPDVANHIIYTKNGDKRLTPRPGYKPQEIQARKWVADQPGLSGRLYEVMILPTEEGRKSKESVVLKELLMNSEGSPEKLFDLVRFTMVFCNDDFDITDPITRKDIYYLLCKICKVYGVKMAGSETIDWENDTADDIYDKFAGRKTVKKGEFTVEDRHRRREKKKEKTLNKQGDRDENKKSNPNLNDIKTLAKDPTHGTGVEARAQGILSWVKSSSKHDPMGHDFYNERKSWDLLEVIYNPFLFPDTWLILRVLKLKSKQYEYDYNVQELNYTKAEKKTAIARIQQSGAINDTIKARCCANMKEELAEIDSEIEKCKAKSQEIEEKIQTIIPLTKALQENNGRLSEVREQAFEVARKLAA